MPKSPFAGVKTSAKRSPVGNLFQSNNSTLHLEGILPRAEDTRPTNQSHVEALAESIAVLGLIQPIAVDAMGRLLAGGHRLAAIKLIKNTNHDAFIKHFNKGIPIRRYDFDAQNEMAHALAIEATENEKRRDYTPREVRELADRLEAAGYHRSKGRAKKGQKSVGPTLAIIVGKSQRTIERYLASEESSNNSKPTNDGFKKHLNASIHSLKKLYYSQPSNKNEQKLLNDVAKMIERLESSL